MNIVCMHHLPFEVSTYSCKGHHQLYLYILKHTHVHLLQFYMNITYTCNCYTLHSHTSTDEVPSDHVLWQFAQPVAQQTKNWGRLVLYLGLLPADAASTQHYQVYMYFTY